MPKNSEKSPKFSQKNPEISGKIPKFPKNLPADVGGPAKPDTRYLPKKFSQEGVFWLYPLAQLCPDHTNGHIVTIQIPVYHTFIPFDVCSISFFSPDQSQSIEFVYVVIRCHSVGIGVLILDQSIHILVMHYNIRLVEKLMIMYENIKL